MKRGFFSRFFPKRLDPEFFLSLPAFDYPCHRMIALFFQYAYHFIIAFLVVSDGVPSA